MSLPEGAVLIEEKKDTGFKLPEGATLIENNEDSILPDVNVPSKWLKGEQSLSEKFVSRFPDASKAINEVSDHLLNMNIFDITSQQSIDHSAELAGLRKQVESMNSPFFQGGSTRGKGAGDSYAPQRGKAFIKGLKGSTMGMVATQELDNFMPGYTSESLLYDFGQMVGDIPAMIGGYIVGGANPISGSAGAFALPAGLRQVYIDKLLKGEVDSWGDFFGRLSNAVKETTKGEITGAATGYMGKISPFGLKTMMEVGTMTTVGAALEGHVPSNEDFIHALVMVSGLKISSKAGSYAKERMMNMYRDYGVKPGDVAKEIDDLIPENDRSITEVTSNIKNVIDDVESRIKSQFLLMPPANMGEGFTFKDSPAPKPETILRKGIEGDKGNYTEGRVNPDLEVVNRPFYKKDVDALMQKNPAGLSDDLQNADTPRGVVEVLQDINSALGKVGAIGDRPHTLEQVVARMRLKDDYNRAQELANKQNKTVGEVLKEGGLDEKYIEKITKMFEPEVVKSTPSDNPDTVKQRNLGTKSNPRYAPEITKSDMEGLKTVNEIDLGPLNNVTVNSLFMFEKMGAWAKDTFYRPMKVAEDAAKRKYIELEVETKSIEKSLPKGAAKRIGIYAISKQESGTAKLQHMKIKEVPKLTLDEMKAYNKLRDYYKTFYEQLQQARIESGKEPFDAVEDYFTFVHQMSFLESLGLSPTFGNKTLLQNAIADNIKDFIHAKATSFGFAKGRVNALYHLDTDAFRVFLKYADVATRHIEKSPVIAKGRELLLKMPDDTILMEKAPNTAKWLTVWLDKQAGQKTTEFIPPLAEKGLQIINNNMAYSVLGGNLRSAFIVQPTSLVNSVVRIGVNNLKSGIAEACIPERRKFASDNSKVLLTREFDVNFVDAMKADGMLGGIVKGYTEGRHWIGNKGMAAIKFMDYQAAVSTWLGAFKKAKTEGMKDTEAFNYADDTVTRTQASALPSDISPIQYTTLGKTLSIFQTFVINDWNFLMKDVAGIKNPEISKGQAVKNMMVWAVGATLFNILYEDILGISSPFPSPLRAAYNALDNGDGLFGASKEIAMEMSQLVPFLGGTRYGSNPFGATVGFIGDVAEKVSDKPGGKPALDLIGKGLGIPGTVQVERMMKEETLKEMMFGKEPKN